MQFLTFLSPNNNSPFVWGIGPTFQFPTVTKQNLGAQKWQIGPDVAFGYIDNKIGMGFLFQQWWSFAGKDNSEDTSTAAFQYFQYFFIQIRFYRVIVLYASSKKQ